MIYDRDSTILSIADSVLGLNTRDFAQAIKGKSSSMELKRIIIIRDFVGVHRRTYGRSCMEDGHSIYGTIAWIVLVAVTIVVRREVK
jgi:hypothetical protein